MVASETRSAVSSAARQEEVQETVRVRHRQRGGVPGQTVRQTAIRNTAPLGRALCAHVCPAHPAYGFSESALLRLHQSQRQTAVGKGSLAGLAVAWLDVLAVPAGKAIHRHPTRTCLPKMWRPAGTAERHRTAGPGHLSPASFHPRTAMPSLMQQPANDSKNVSSGVAARTRQPSIARRKQSPQAPAGLTLCDSPNHELVQPSQHHDQRYVPAARQSADL